MNLIMARGEFLGWSGDGTKGYCCVEPKRVFVDGNRIKCRYFLSKAESEGDKK